MLYVDTWDIDCIIIITRRLLAVQSSFNPQKGLAHLIEALALLRDDGVLLS